MAKDLRDLMSQRGGPPPPTTAATLRFDRWAAAYDSCSLQPMYQAAHRSLLSIAITITPSPQRILDLGCGTGLLCRSLRISVPHASIVGVDASWPMLRVAAHRPGIGWICAAVEQLPFRDASFDLITASFTTRHWNDAHQAAHEAARILAPGGTLAIADAFACPPPGILADLLRRPQPIPEPLRTALPGAGLHRTTAQTIDGYGPIPTITVVTAIRQRPTNSPTATSDEGQQRQ